MTTPTGDIQNAIIETREKGAKFAEVILRQILSEKDKEMDEQYRKKFDSIINKESVNTVK